MPDVVHRPEPAAAPDLGELSPRIRRLKHRLYAADYEICLARARHFTDAFRATEGAHPALRIAEGLRRTLAHQRIFLHADEELAGTKTERYLSTPLPVERGDFLRALELELDILDQKRRPFHMSKEDRQTFRREILPYWNGRTLHDRKAKYWAEDGLLALGGGPRGWVRTLRDAVRFGRHVGRDNLRKIAGAGARAPLTALRLRTLVARRHELAFVMPTPAFHCMDVQGHLTIGIDRVVSRGMAALADEARARRARLVTEEPGRPGGVAFLDAAITCLEAAMAYADRFAERATDEAARATDADERRRLERLAAHCRRVPRAPARTFHEALQSAWMTQVVAEIQFGTMDVFGVGRIDQYLGPLYEQDRAAGILSRAQAIALLQEYFLKLSANISPTPEIGMESNGVLGNSQHCVVLGGLDARGEDATNELSTVALEAYEQMGGTVNQLCVRIHDGTPPAFLRRTAEVFRRTNGIALYHDEAVIQGLLADGFTLEHARDYTIVGCVETCGHSNTQGCVAGHDLVLPAVLLLALTDGHVPPPLPGQGTGYASGAAASLTTFDELFAAFERQLAHQVDLLVRAVAGKDRAHREALPAPLVSALIDGCVERALDVTEGGARYDFTSIDVRGLATTVDSLLALRHFVYERQVLTLPAFMAIVLQDWVGNEELRQCVLAEAPRYGTGDAAADALALRVIERLHGLVAGRKNVRGGRYRVACFSLGNHVVDGFLLGATPDGRRRSMPVSNGVSPSNLASSAGGPQAAMRAAAHLPPAQVSSGIALNLRFHPGFIRSRRGLETFVALVRTYFAQGGMHVQPNFVSAETLRDAQRHPERYPDLVVKVAGYSACFVDLGRSIQDDIIDRAEFGAGGAADG